MESSAAAAAAAAAAGEATAASLVGELLGIQLFSDGRVVRPSKPLFPETPADPTFTDGVASKDVVIQPKTGLSARIFLPLSVVRAAEKESSRKQIPVLVYYHGGGFVHFGPSTSVSHNLCNNVAPKLGLLVVSVDYRLAPEHRLPVAFEDSFEALKWIQQQAKRHEDGGDDDEGLEPWLKYADPSNCLLMGHSAGATICHRMVLKASEYDLSPLKIKGIVPVVPFFGGFDRSVVKLKSPKQPEEPTLEDLNALWFFSLPEGAEANHPFSRCPSVEEVVDVNIPPVLIVVGAKDALHSKQVEYVEVLKKAGKDVQLLQYEDHGHFLLFPEVEDKVHNSYIELFQFMDKCFSYHH